MRGEGEGLGRDWEPCPVCPQAGTRSPHNDKHHKHNHKHVSHLDDASAQQWTKERRLQEHVGVWAARAGGPRVVRGLTVHRDRERRQRLARACAAAAAF